MCAEFVSVCRQSTDFHFPGIDTQLQGIKVYGKIAKQERQEKKFSELSSGSHTPEGWLLSINSFSKPVITVRDNCYCTCTFPRVLPAID